MPVEEEKPMRQSPRAPTKVRSNSEIHHPTVHNTAIRWNNMRRTYIWLVFMLRVGQVFGSLADVADTAWPARARCAAAMLKFHVAAGLGHVGRGRGDVGSSELENVVALDGGVFVES